MLKKRSVYKCELCGNIVESVWDGKPSVQCCGQAMTELAVNTVDASQEKHVPVIERDGNTVKVKVGSVAHPMTDKHYILFIEVIDGDYVYRRDLKKGDEVAEAVFTVKSDKIIARQFCNLHGFWSAEEA